MTNPFVGEIFEWISGLFALTREHCADRSIYLASTPDIEGMAGKYSIKREPARSSLISNGEKVAVWLWEISGSQAS